MLEMRWFPTFKFSKIDLYTWDFCLDPSGRQ